MAANWSPHFSCGSGRSSSTVRWNWGRVLAVTHPGPIRAMAAIALSVPFDAFWRIDVEPLGRLTLTSDGKRWHLRALIEPERGFER